MGKPLKIFVVDDNFHARDILKRMLMTLDMNIEIVGEAETGQEAILMYEDAGPDIVMLELDNLSHLRSIDVVRALRSMGSARVVMCIMCKDKHLLTEFHNADLLDDFIEKPYIRAKVGATLKAVAGL